jgi:hypothetical protein
MAMGIPVESKGTTPQKNRFKSECTYLQFVALNRSRAAIVICGSKLMIGVYSSIKAAILSGFLRSIVDERRCRFIGCRNLRFLSTAAGRTGPVRPCCPSAAAADSLVPPAWRSQPLQRSDLPA